MRMATMVVRSPAANTTTALMVHVMSITTMVATRVAMVTVS